MLSFDRKPSVDLNKYGELRFFFHQKKYSFLSNVELNKWYNISIEQKTNNKRVRKIQKYTKFYELNKNQIRIVGLVIRDLKALGGLLIGFR